MKNKNAGRLLAFLIILTFLIFPATGFPLTVQSGHPRVYINPARLNEIQTASQVTIPLNKSSFPQSAGTLMFDINPTPRTDTTQSTYLGIFDNYNYGHNHIFIRHVDDSSCNAPQGSLCFQVALQSSVDPNYIGSSGFTLTANQWHTVRVSWNSIQHTASLQIDGGALQDLGWDKYLSSNNQWVPYDWQPSDQNFTFSGRDGLDNILVYGSDNPASGPLLVNYPMNDGSGVTVADVSGNGYNARVSLGVSWAPRSASDPNMAIYMDGKTGSLRVIAASVLTEAWVDFYAKAVGLAYQLNTNPNSSPVNLSTGAPDSIKGVARDLGLAYLVTGETQFHTAALAYANLLHQVNAADGGDYPEGGRVEAMGVIYDWLYGDMSTVNPSSGQTYGADLASAIKATVLAMQGFVCGNGTLDPTAWTCSNSSADPSAIGGHSHQDNTEISAAVLAIIDEHPELQPLLATEYQNFVNLYNPLRAWVGVDGGFHMGWGYGAAYTFLDSIQLWNTATTDILMTDSWQGKLIDRYVYGMRGDLTFPASGDALVGFSPHDETVVGFALWGARYFNNATGLSYYNRWILPAESGGRFNELLYWEPNLPTAPIEQLDFSRLFQNVGQVVMRDSWDYLNATLLEFKSTSFWTENHEHLDQNAFTIFYKAPLLVDSGYYDNYGSSHWRNYFTRPIAHNTISVWDPQETFTSSNYSAYIYSNDGGQQLTTPLYPTLPQIEPGGSNHFDGITAYEYTPNYTYTVGNASKAYSSSKLDQSNGFVRSLVFLRTPGFWSHPVTVVFDKVTKQPNDAGLVTRFLLHSATEPEPQTGPGITTVPGNTLVIHNEGGMLFSQTLLPVNPVLTKIGGIAGSSDYRFLAPMCTSTTPCQTNADYYTALQPFTPATIPAGDSDVGAWRVEVTAPTPSQREYFLNVLSVADYGAVSAPPTAQNLPSANAAVALLGGTQLVAFNEGDQPATFLTWNMPSADVAMLVTGLVPNAMYSGSIAGNGSTDFPYTVTLNQDQNGTLAVSAQGVLSVNSSLAALGTDLSVFLVATPNPVYVGQSITYIVSVTNNGPSAASAVTLSGLPGCNLSTNIIPSGGTASCSVSSTANTAGTVTQSVSVSGAEIDPNPANNTANVSVMVNPAADLSMALTGSPNPVLLGQTETYTITVTNNGPSSATNVTASGTLPSCSLGTLASGASASCTATATAASVGTLSQTMSASATEVDPNPANNNVTVTTTVNAPDLTPTAMSATKSGSKVYVSDTIQNQGNGGAGAFTVSYYLSTNTTYEPGTDLALVTTSSGSTPCTRTVSSLSPGATSSVSSLTCYKPANAVSGQRYYVLVVDDATNQVIESNETNNGMAAAGQVWW